MKRKALLTLFALVLPVVAQEAKTAEKPAQSRLFRNDPNIELTVYLMLGLAQPSEPDALPKDLDGVAMQLRGLFAYQSYRVLDTIIMRSRHAGSATVRGSATVPGNPRTATYQIDFRSIFLAPDERGNLVRIDGLRLGVQVPYGGGNEFREAGFNTSIDVREGQKVVVGKANMDGSNNALILVVTAKVVE